MAHPSWRQNILHVLHSWLKYGWLATDCHDKKYFHQLLCFHQRHTQCPWCQPPRHRLPMASRPLQCVDKHNAFTNRGGSRSWRLGGLVFPFFLLFLPFLFFLLSSSSLSTMAGNCRGAWGGSHGLHGVRGGWIPLSPPLDPPLPGGSVCFSSSL